MSDFCRTLRYLNDYFPMTRTENRVPHLEQEGASYFVTYRLHDSIPQELLAELRAEKEGWLKLHPKPWSVETESAYHRIFSVKIDRWLDAGMGSCALRDSGCREIVSESLQHLGATSCHLHSFVIMPNHVHVLLTPQLEASLEKIMGGTKKYTARLINLRLEREGKFWFRSYFDRIIRDPNHLLNVVRYVRRNSEKAGLSDDEFTIWESRQVAGISGRR